MRSTAATQIAATFTLRSRSCRGARYPSSSPPGRLAEGERVGGQATRVLGDDERPQLGSVVAHATLFVLALALRRYLGQDQLLDGRLVH